MTTTEKADGDIAGPFTLAAYARNEDTGAQVIWVNCGNMDNEGIYQVIPGNVTFLQGCAASLAGQESAVLIDSKALEAAPLEVPGIAASTLGLLFVIVLPAALLAVGAVVVVLRSRK
jgi:ABC-2 type transport system permease protein